MHFSDSEHQFRELAVNESAIQARWPENAWYMKDIFQQAMSNWRRSWKPRCAWVQLFSASSPSLPNPMLFQTRGRWQTQNRAYRSSRWTQPQEDSSKWNSLRCNTTQSARSKSQRAVELKNNFMTTLLQLITPASPCRVLYMRDHALNWHNDNGVQVAQGDFHLHKYYPGRHSLKMIRLNNDAIPSKCKKRGARVTEILAWRKQTNSAVLANSAE